MRILRNADIAALAGVADLVKVIADTMRAVSAREAQMPLRFVVPLAGGDRFGVMAGAVPGIGHGAKLLTLRHSHGGKSGSSHRGAMILLDAESGTPAAVMDSGLLTALRTAAASAVATAALAREDASHLAILGYGEQAQRHIEAICAIRPITRLSVWGRSAEKAAAFAARFPGARAMATIEEAVAEADIVCAVTTAREPILDASMLPEGVHVNAVGASTPDVQEIAADLYRDCKAYVDYRPSAEGQAADLIAARKSGFVTGEVPEIGEVLSGRAVGSTGARERTLYRSLGLIAQDLAAASFFLRRAEQADKGIFVDLYGEGVKS